MAETIIQDSPEKFVDQVPTFGKFQLPKDFDKKPEPEAKAAPEVVKPAESAPVAEGVEPEQTEPTTTTKESEKPKEEVPSSRRFERRIDRATKARAEAEQRAEALAREVAELKSKTAAPTDPLEPKMEQFSDIEEYAKAKASYAVKQESQAREQKLQQQTIEGSRKALLSRWTEETIKGEDKYDDFTEVVGDLKPTAPWSIGIMKSENPADVAYYLGKHLKEAQKIIALDPVSQIFEVAKISLKLSQTPVAPKTPSKAPAPISPVGAAATSKEASVAEPMSMEQYMKVGAKAFRR